MFACRFPRRFGLTTYASALSLWEGRPKKKGYEDPDWRDLFGRPRDNCVVYKTAKGDIRFRLYSHDVVTFEPDGSVLLDPYASNSTNNFVWAILGPGVSTHWLDRAHSVPDHITCVGGHYYNTPEYAQLRYDTDRRRWQVVAGDRPFVVPRVNKSMTKAVLKTSGFMQFSLWLRTQIRLGIDPRGGTSHYSRGGHTTDSVIRCLNEPDRYDDIASSLSLYSAVDDQLAEMRRAVYAYHGAITEHEVPCFAHWQELNNALSLMRRYG